MNLNVPTAASCMKDASDANPHKTVHPFAPVPSFLVKHDVSFLFCNAPNSFYGLLCLAFRFFLTNS